MKNLRLVFKNTDGQKQDITMPMEKWIRDWCYECDFVPENGEVPEIAELDGKDILKNFPDYANSFEDIAYKYMWDGFHNDFYGDVRVGKVEDNGDAFEQWLKDNVNSENMISADKLIETFTDMANRGTLLCGRNITQEDLLIQIIGTIVKVSMDSEADETHVS